MNINSIEWKTQHASLNEAGYAILPGLLSKQECQELRACYSENHLYRATICVYSICGKILNFFPADLR